MKKQSICQYIIGVLIISVALSSCASIKDFTPGAFKNDIQGMDNLPGCQFFISKDVHIHYKCVTREAEPDKNGVIQVKVDTVERTASVLHSTPGVIRAVDGAGNNLLFSGVSWRTVETRSGDELAIIQIVFWDSDDNWLEFSAFYDDDADLFRIYKVRFVDEQDGIPPLSLTGTDTDVRRTYKNTSGKILVDAYGNLLRPQSATDVLWKEETTTVIYDTGDEPYLLYKLIEKQKSNEKTKKAKGRKVGG